MSIPAVPMWVYCAALWRAGFTQFRVSLLGKLGNPALQSFWTEMQKHPFGRDHPALRAKNLGRVIPLLVHIDGAEMYTNSEFYVLQFSSLMAVDSNVLDTRFPCIKIPHAWMREKTVKAAVMRRLADWVAWNMSVLQDGHGPPHGYAQEPWPEGGPCSRLVGERLMGDYSGAYMGFKSDAKARKEAHCFVQNYQTTKLCDRCEAVQPFAGAMRSPALKRLRYTDMSAHAPWRTTRIDHVQHMQSGTASLWACISGYRHEMTFHDPLHVKPLGIDRNLTAWCIVDFLQRGELTNLDTEISLKTLWVDFCKFCRSHGLSAPRATLSMRVLGRSKETAIPGLHTGIKATVVKWLVVFLAKRAGEMDTSTEYLQIRASCLWSAAEFYYITDNAGILLTPEERGRLQYAGSLFVMTFAALCKLTESRHLFTPRPKVHYLDEFITQAVDMGLNPSCMANWGEEALLGKVKRLSRMCHGGTMLATAMKRHFLALAMRWRKRRETGRWHLRGE